MSSTPPIGVFDSGVGGLVVLRRIHARMPEANTIYIADQAHTPYGSRSPDFIIDRARRLTEALAGRGCELIVLACNTATAAAIDTLRAEYRELSFVGMEPAVKPAAAMTETNVIGVLATEGTLSAERYEALAAAHTSGITIVHRIGAGLVMDVERGAENHPATAAKLAAHAASFSAAGADVVVLGCTHFSFLSDQLANAGAGRFTVIDPADSVARQAARMAAFDGATAAGTTRIYLTTSAAPDAARFSNLMGSQVAVTAILD